MSTASPKPFHRTQKSHAQEPKDRAKRTPINPHPKKQGGGGKYTWGNEKDLSIYDRDDDYELDPNDPLAEDVLTSKEMTNERVQKLKAKVQDAAKQFLRGQTLSDVHAAVKKMSVINFDRDLPKYLVGLCLARKNEKDDVIELVKHLQEEKMLSRDQVENAVHCVYEEDSDMQLSKEEALTWTVLGFERVIV